MSCPDPLRVQAYFDGEVDAVAAADIEGHVEGCAHCRELLQDLERMRAALRTDLSDFRATPALRARISAALDQKSSDRAPHHTAGTRAPLRSRPFWLGALSGVAASAMTAVLAFVFLMPLLGSGIVDDLAGAHIRSLMPAHLIDVQSTDKHTVKPWFAAHADVSPVVADFAKQGYRLVGGRADYLAHQRAAVVVYQHGAHIVNVFSWAGSAAHVPQSATRNGYHFVFWRAGDLDYCAVSDTGWDELQGLVRLLRNLNSSDLPRPAPE